MRSDGEDILLVQEFRLFAHLIACLKNLSVEDYSTTPETNPKETVETKKKDNFQFPSFQKKGHFLQ